MTVRMIKFYGIIFKHCVIYLYKINCRQEQFEQSAAGRAAKAQLAAAAKQNANTNKGEPVLKVLFSLFL